MAFDKSKHVIRVQGGREYLPVSARLVWFREEHPDWAIVTNPIEINLEKQYAIFSATIMNAEGKVMATATKMENVRGFGDYLEKAETGSVGRALAYCGYGTQFEPGLDEGDRFNDGPAGSGNRFAAPGGGNNNGPNRGGGGFGGGFNSGGNGGSTGNRFGNGGGNMPGPLPAARNNVEQRSALPAAQQQRPVAAPPPLNVAPPDDENSVGGDHDAPADFNENDGRPPAPPMNAGSGNRVGERSSVPAPARPVGARPAPPPSGAVAADDEDDPFADLNEPAPPPRPANSGAPPPVRNAAAARAAVAAQQNESGETVLTANRCSEEGCPVMLTPGQVKLSTGKFGRSLCPRHQRDAAPAGNKPAADALL